MSRSLRSLANNTPGYKRWYYNTPGYKVIFTIEILYHSNHANKKKSRGTSDTSYTNYVRHISSMSCDIWPDRELMVQQIFQNIPPTPPTAPLPTHPLYFTIREWPNNLAPPTHSPQVLSSSDRRGRRQQTTCVQTEPPHPTGTSQ